MKNNKVFQIIGALDTETTNFKNGLEYCAFPILFQIGLLKAPITEINQSNVKDKTAVSIFRNHEKCYDFLDSVIDKYANSDITGVILVHNLAFDFYSFAPWLIDKEIKVLAKTPRKPIAISILDESQKPILVLLDTLGLYMKSLARMGEECGMPKAVTDWDYSLIRTLETPLTDNEIYYAKQDIYTLLVYTSYFLNKNPDIEADEIGKTIFTKTGVVRAKRLFHLGKLKNKAGQECKRLWATHNHTQQAKTDDELFTMHACTRGGFTFCARNHASKIYECDNMHAVVAYDATSQHPAQMVSHLYPVNFEKATKRELKAAITCVKNVSVKRILKNWVQPFLVAFNAKFAFKNLRPKENSLFKTHGIYPLASARLYTIANNIDYEEDTSRANFREMLDDKGYKDIAINAKCAFGKLESAEYAELFLTELSLWEVFQCYEFDSIEPISGYISVNFRKATDLSVLSVMRFYKAKNALKETMKDGRGKRLKGLFPDSFVNKVIDGSATDTEMREYYMLSKADLNSLFGIEATNECKQDFILTQKGIEITGSPGLENMPKQPKCNYQFGQRIVGWSRIAQIVAMILLEKYAIDIINGDTDSLKIYLSKNDINKADNELLKIGKAIDKAKKYSVSRVKNNYPDYYDSLDEIGYYIKEDEYKYFSASWNKSYISSHDGKTLNIVLAGVPTSRGDKSIKSLGEKWLKSGVSFNQAASVLIGYNVTFDYSLTRLNGRKHPKFGEMLSLRVTDYKGATYDVYAPSALALYPELKTIGDTDKADNAINCDFALANNNLLNTEPIILDSETDYEEIMNSYNLLDL